MPLITNPDGSHRFVMDQAATSSFDVESLVQARQRPSIGQPIRPGEWNIQPLPGFPGVSYFQVVLGGEGRGVYRQRGTFDQGLTDYSEQTLVYDDYEIARLPIKWEFNNSGLSAPPNPVGMRVYGALFQGSYVIIAGSTSSPHTFTDVGSGYASSISPMVITPIAGATYPVCMRAVQIFGASMLLIGWNAGAVSSLQAISDLSPFTSPGGVGSGGATTWGVMQTPVDGDSLQIYTEDASGGIIKMMNTNTNLGTGVVSDRIRIPAGGYTVGMVNLDGNPEVFYAAPQNAAPAIRAFTGGTWYPPETRLKLLRVDLRALTVYPVATALPFVLWAIAGDNQDGAGAHDIFYCNGTDHQYMTHGADIPILPSADRPQLPPECKRWCGGHWYKDGRFYWEENVYDAFGTTTTTKLQRFEFDPALGRQGARPVSAPYETGLYGVQSMGSPNLPWSPLNNCLTSRTTDTWLSQYQPSRSQTGYSVRHVDGSSILLSPIYEASGYRRWPALRPPGRPGAVMALSRVTGPPPANLRTGSGADASGDFHNTRVVFHEAHTLPDAVFYGDDGVDSDGQTRWRPAVDYPDNDAWTDELDITITAYRDDVMNMCLHYTPNPGPIVVEGYLREMGAPPPSRNILNWAADRIAADDLSRPLL